MRRTNKQEQRLGEIKYNNQGCPMKIVDYINHDNIIVEFQDKYKCRIHTKYSHFVIARSFADKPKNKRPTYKNATCCDEWLLYENFYEWLHN